ncbi:hypothetical protein CONCODRAFT_12343 [Conidiobolus coronatus NRRL 28638]|uniref:Uncharacterized protein n=1 Tax=Conidiobolus coronatus (strain ATCC 28846 / CBS 209.66 / NRRL 28638) TaxID=796925 RepID=A0A137NT20_CONC2|nr:hypothetical protein CONCODRAFT_12343 [Conidiobolus coronatus NRRL 28638]|eukprot:KXN65935.1 hypothetical protein CONCODRAFT_12343 [Conidiobolus coronatus NRRL 28638]
MASFKALIFTLSAILAVPAGDSADYFVNGIFDPSFRDFANPNADSSALPFWGHMTIEV